MDGSPQLLTNIQFAEAKKGYDREQVDNFLRELSVKIGELQDMLRQATQRAESAEVRASDAAKARTTIEADLAEVRAELELVQARAAEAAEAAATSASSSDAESATGMLLLAQKTADAAVAEAEARAVDTLTEAKSRAAMIAIESEQEAARLKREAIDEADSLRANRVSRMEAEVAKLSVQRDELQSDIDVLQSYVDDHRAKLREHVSTFTQLLDEPGLLHLAPRPEVVGEPADLSRRRTGPAAEQRAAQISDLVETPGAANESDVSPSEVAGDAEDEEPGRPGGHPMSEATTSEPEADHPAPDDTGSDTTGELPLAETGPTATTAEPAMGAADVAADADSEADAAPREPEPAEGAGASPFAVPTGIDRQPFQPEDGGRQVVQSSLIDLTAARLFEDAGAEPTRSFDVLADEEPSPSATGPQPDYGAGMDSQAPVAPGSPLGEPDADADEAMRAFFERDFPIQDGGPDDRENRGRFLRRK